MNWKQILRTDVSTVFRGFVPPHVYHARHGHKWTGPTYVHRIFWRRDLLVVTAQLQAIVRCNAPLVQGLELAAWDAPRRKVQLILQALHDDIASGMALHEAMRQRGRFFPRYYVDLIKVGETTGSLATSLSQLQDHLTAERTRSASIWGWIGYLSFVAIVQVWALLMLSLFIFPVYTETLGDLVVQPPAAYQIMANIGSAVSVVKDRVAFTMLDWLVATVLALAFLGVLMLVPMSNISAGIACRPFKALGSKIPFLHTVIAKSDFGLAARVLERLLRAGIPINEALRDCAELDIAPAQQSALRSSKRRIEEGLSLSAAVAQDRRFPESFRALVSLGESSGKLPSAFGRIADLYEQQTLKTTRILVDTVCPCGVLILGGVVLLFELSIFTFLTALADSIGGFG